MCRILFYDNLLLAEDMKIFSVIKFVEDYKLLQSDMDLARKGCI
jgi:hypothetical protein